MLPKRVHRIEEARREFGSLVDRLLPFLESGDPLADSAVAVLADMPAAEGWSWVGKVLEQGVANTPGTPQALQDFFSAIEYVPVWVDWGRLERAGHLLLRAGVFGRIVLGAKSLVHGYCAPAGNKPLVFSGRLQNKTMRRLMETARFVQAVCEPGGMRPGGKGFQITARVRLMHAQVRLLLLRSGEWRDDLWSLPINQHDMMATNLLFSSVWMDGVRRFGIQIHPEEADDFMHLWRYIGYVIGVQPELLPTSETEAERLGELIYLTQGAPDQDSKDLVRALLEAPFEALKDKRKPHQLQKRIEISQAICRYMVGDELADALELPRHSQIAVFFPVLRSLVEQTDKLRRRLPLADKLSLAVEEQIWERFVANGLRGQPAEFLRPESLGGGAYGM